MISKIPNKVTITFTKEQIETLIALVDRAYWDYDEYFSERGMQDAADMLYILVGAIGLTLNDLGLSIYNDHKKDETK